jgi:hypothetical protein
MESGSVLLQKVAKNAAAFEGLDEFELDIPGPGKTQTKAIAGRLTIVGSLRIGAFEGPLEDAKGTDPEEAVELRGSDLEVAYDHPDLIDLHRPSQ